MIELNLSFVIQLVNFGILVLVLNVFLYKPIRKVLADDAQVRRYTEPWMEQLQVFLGSARQENKLLRAYDTGGSQA